MGITPKQAAELNEQRNISLTNLARKRVERNMSQRKLSVTSGVPSRIIMMLEQREKLIEEMSLTSLIDICLALNCSIIDILESDDIIEKTLQIFNGDCLDVSLDIPNDEQQSDNVVTYRERFIEFLKKNYLTEIPIEKEKKLEIVINDFLEEWVKILTHKYIENISEDEIAMRMECTHKDVEKSLANATRILKCNFGVDARAAELPDYEKDKLKEQKKSISVYERSIKELKLNIRTYNLFKEAGVITVGDALMPKDELMTKFRMSEYMANEVITKINEYLNGDISSAND